MVVFGAALAVVIVFLPGAGAFSDRIAAGRLKPDAL